MLSVACNQTFIILPAIISSSSHVTEQNLSIDQSQLYPNHGLTAPINPTNPRNKACKTELEPVTNQLSSLILSPSSATCITDLDDYSLLQILSYISNIREKIRMKRVCLRFYRLSTESLRYHHRSINRREDVYYASEIRPFCRNEKRVRLPFDKILTNCPKLNEFKSTACERICYNITKLPIELTNMVKLTLHGWSNVKMSSSIVRRCVNLEYLDLGCIKMGKNFDYYTTDLTMIKSDQLSTLRLHGVHYSLANIQSFMSTKGSNLQSFQYSSSLITSTSSTNLSPGLIITPFDSAFFTTLIQIVFNFCHNLIHFEMKLVDHDGFGTTLPNLVPLKHLTSLIVKTERRAFNIELLETILRNCPSLEYLVIVSSFLTEDDVLELCKKYCPLIKKITQRPFNWHEIELN